MSQPNENTPQPNESRPELSFNLSSEQAHVEITLPSQQVRQILRPLTTLLTHLIAAGLATISLNPALLQFLENTTPPLNPECHHLQSTKPHLPILLT